MLHNDQGDFDFYVDILISLKLIGGFRNRKYDSISKLLFLQLDFEGYGDVQTATSWLWDLIPGIRQGKTPPSVR